jgi:hypothetical protein
MDRLLRPLITLAAAALAAACTSPALRTYPPGTASAAVLQDLGAPSAEYKNPAGGRRWEYAGGTYGRHTYMLDFDATDRLVGSDQVWTEAHFDTIQAGMGANDVLARIGKPSTTWNISWQRQAVWSYRYDTPFCRWFMVGMSRDGQVMDTSYGPDPLCSRDGNAGRAGH